MIPNPFSTAACGVLLLLLPPAASAIPLQQAIDEATGNIVVLDPEITYTGIAEVRRDLIIEGNGATYDQTPSGGGAGELRLQAGSLVIRDLNLVAVGVALYSSEADINLELDGVTIAGTPGTTTGGVLIDGANAEVRILDTTFRDLGDMGITIRESGAQISMSRARFNDVTIGLRSRGGVLEAAACTFTNNMQALDGLETALITGCTFSNTAVTATNWGIKMDSTVADPAARSLIVNASSFTGHDFGISFAGKRAIVAGCFFTDMGIAINAHEDLVVSDTTFNNAISDGDTWAIKMNVGAPDTSAVDLTVTGSRFTGHTYAISFLGDQATIAGCRFTDHQIAIDAYDDVAVTESTFTNVGLGGTSWAIKMDLPPADPEALDLTVTGSTFTGQTYGISFDGNQATVTGSRFNNHQIAIDAYHDLTVSDTTFTNIGVDGTTWAIKMNTPPADPEIVDLTVSSADFSGQTFGIAFTGNHATISESTFADHRIAIDAFHNLTVTNSTFTRVEEEPDTWAIKTDAAGGNPLQIVVVVNGITVDNYWWGIDTPARSLTVENSQFSRGEKAIILTGEAGTTSNPAQITGNTFTVYNSGTVDFSAGGVLRMAGNEFRDVIAALYSRGGGRLILEDNLIDDEGRRPIQNAILANNAMVIEARRNTIRGFINSIVQQTDGSLVAEDNVFEACAFSGLIIADNVNAAIRRNQFLNNGQDGIFIWQKVVSLPEARPSTSIIEDNVVINAGIGPIDPSVGRPEQAGTGIALQGYHTVRRNLVIGSHDQGISMTYSPTDVLAEENVLLNNRLSALMMAEGSQATLRRNLSAGSHGAGAAGLVVFNTGDQGSVLAENNAMLANDFGILHNDLTESSVLRRNLVAGNRSQGISINDGYVAMDQLGLAGNADWQIFYNGPAQPSVINNSSFLAAGQNGLYAFNHPGVDARNNWWGPGGPVDSFRFAPEQGQMAFQGATVEPYETAPPVETFTTLANVPTISATQTPWLALSAPPPADPSTAIFAAMRYLPAAGELPQLPEGLADQRLIQIWTTPDWQHRPQATAAQLDIQAPATSGPLQLLRLDPETGAPLASFAASTPVAGTVRLSLDTAQLVTGVYAISQLGPFPDSIWAIY